MGTIYQVQTSLFLISAGSVLPQGQTVPLLPVTEVFLKLYIYIIMGCNQAPLGKEGEGMCVWQIALLENVCLE